ncbi:MAG: hypothetical protein M3Y59_18625 [Myxococcota bacterium]|nr:hypothetical protein [Myxococcota bacterium]
MQREDLLVLVTALGREFSKRGMRDHRARLRVYYFALKHGLTSGQHALDVQWSERFVIDWMKTLRVPPFEQALQIRARGAPCGQCRQSGQQPWIYTDGVFPGGVRMRCQTCGDLWLEAEG